MNRNMNGSAGFTLLEVLVGLALMAILSILLVTALRTGTGLWERRSAGLDGTELASAFRTLQSNLERALPIPECLEPNAPCVVAFDGGPTEMRFVVANPGRVGRLGNTIMRLSIERGEGGLFLSIAWALYDPKVNIRVESFNETLLLLEGVEEIRFDYFGEAPAEPFARAWHQEWQTRGTLPAVVRMSLRSEKFPAQAWSIRLLNAI